MAPKAPMNRHDEDHPLLSSSEVAGLVGQIVLDGSETEYAKGKNLTQALNADNPSPVVVLNIKGRLSWIRRHRILGSLIEGRTKPGKGEDAEDQLSSDVETVTYRTPDGAVKLVHFVNAGDPSKVYQHRVSNGRSLAAKIGPLVHEQAGVRGEEVTVFIPKELFDDETLTGIAEGLGNTGAKPTKDVLGEVQTFKKEHAGESILEQGQLVDGIAGVRRSVQRLNVISDTDMASDLFALALTEMEEGDEIARAKAVTRVLSELAPNIMTTSAFVKTVRQVVANLNQVLVEREDHSVLQMEVIGPKGDPLTTDGMTFEKYPMGLLTSVHSGSTQDGPYFVRIKYRPIHGDKPEESLSQTIKRFVGKGMMFDDGGRIPKPHPHGQKMKADMQGAATLVGMLVGAVRTGSHQPFDVCLCVCANENGEHARRVDDIMIGADGATYEEIHPDAEGREAVRDGVFMSQKLLEDEGEDVGQVTTVCTLTGAAWRSVGGETLFIGHDQDTIHRAAMTAGEHGEPSSSLAGRQSDVEAMKGKSADWRNHSSAEPRGSQTGFAFIHRDDKTALHLDIAGHLFKEPQHSNDIKAHELSAGEGVAGLLGLLNEWASEEE
jgi:leucyl aminopeptidase